MEQVEEPQTKKATLSALDFHRVVRATQAVELAQRTAELAAVREQQRVIAVATQRDTVWREVAAAHDLPDTITTIRWNDETYEIEVT
jgi:hypothetical protein